MSKAADDAGNARIAREAAAWWARLRASPHDGDRDAFAAWRSADPAHDAAYDRLERAWTQGKLLEQTGTGRRRRLGRASIFDRQPTLTWAMTASAGIVLATGVTLAVRSSGGVGPTTRDAVAVAVAADRLRSIRLGDGSQITLDTASRVRTKLSSIQRLVWLDAGRARFTVAHDAARPFVVAANGVTVTARGTIFDVAVTASGANVVLLRGSVVVRHGVGDHRSTQVLAPGQQIDIDRQQSLALPKPVAPRATQWASGMLALDKTPLATAIAEINRHNQVQIVLRAGRLGERSMSGAFRSDDPEGFAAAVATIFGLDVVHGRGATLILTEKGKSPTFEK